ncbi:MAG: hypothetical protein M1836_003746 [Candelina mexicana]|nr:MAG: hypothetical protein M1836_003746 [Candelina mexicana]
MRGARETIGHWKSALAIYSSAREIFPSSLAFLRDTSPQTFYMVCFNYAMTPAAIAVEDTHPANFTSIPPQTLAFITNSQMTVCECVRVRILTDDLGLETRRTLAPIPYLMQQIIKRAFHRLPATRRMQSVATVKERCNFVDKTQMHAVRGFAA